MNVPLIYYACNMNCDKKFLGCCQLEAAGYSLGLIHAGASVAAMVLFLNHMERLELNLWILACGFVFWCFHFAASVLLIVGTAKVKNFFKFASKFHEISQNLAKIDLHRSIHHPLHDNFHIYRHVCCILRARGSRIRAEVVS